MSETQEEPLKNINLEEKEDVKVEEKEENLIELLKDENVEMKNEIYEALINKVRSESLNFIKEYNINEKSLKIMNKIIENSPSVLEDITLKLKEVIKDEKITLTDIPNIILICKDIFNLHTSLKTIKLSREEIIDFIKNLIIIFINLDFIKISNSDKELFINLVDLCIKLLETKVDLQKTCLLKCFKH